MGWVEMWRIFGKEDVLGFSPVPLKICKVIYDFLTLPSGVMLARIFIGRQTPKNTTLCNGRPKPMFRTL